MSPQATPEGGADFADGGNLPVAGWTSPSIHRRRAGAVRARRRRLLLLDLAIALLLAVLAIVILPGLALVAFAAVVVLLACGASLGYERVRRRRR